MDKQEIQRVLQRAAEKIGNAYVALEEVTEGDLAHDDVMRAAAAAVEPLGLKVVGAIFSEDGTSIKIGLAPEVLEVTLNITTGDGDGKQNGTPL